MFSLKTDSKFIVSYNSKKTTNFWKYLSFLCILKIVLNKFQIFLSNILGVKAHENKYAVNCYVILKILIIILCAQQKNQYLIIVIDAFSNKYLYIIRKKFIVNTYMVWVNLTM